MQPAIALLEFDSIAIGISAGDAMVKRAPVDVTYAGTVHPGKYLVLVGGDVACVEESYAAGLAVGDGALVDRIILPSAHPDLVRTLRGMHGRVTGEALGIVETRTVAATIGSADRGLKGAEVDLVELRLADRLGGKAYCIFSGTVADVEAAVDRLSGVSVERISGRDRYDTAGAVAEATVDALGARGLGYDGAFYLATGES